MIRLLRLLQGYVVFEASGGFTERFLNLCKVNNINLWNVKNSGGKVCAFTTLREFNNINIAAENSGMNIEIIKNCGFPNFIKRYKWRFGIVLGSVFVAVFIFIMSCFIWEVEIVADSNVKVDGFTDAVEESGIKIGALKSKIDVIYIQEELLAKFSQVSWVSVNIFGTKAQVEYSYAPKPKPITDSKSPVNVVASKSGKITLVECYRGKSVVKIGEVIPKDALLISGVIQNGDLSETLTHASGKIFARTQNSLKKVLNTSINGKIIIDKASSYSLKLFALKIPLGRSSKKFGVCNTEIFLKGNDVTLPFGLVRTDEFDLIKKDIFLSQNQAKMLCFTECVKHKRTNYKNSTIEKCEFSVESSTFENSVCMKITCVENIAREIPISIE